MYYDRTGEEYYYEDCVYWYRDIDEEPCSLCTHPHSAYEPMEDENVD